MTRWFSSDLHLGDPHMTKRRYCGEDVVKHDAWLASRWDAKISDTDEVWLLGDIVAGMRMVDFAAWLRQRPGTKHLVMGNWDEDLDPFPAAWHKVGFETVCFEQVLQLSDGSVVRMTHRPPPADSTEKLWLHGHTHRPVKVTRPGVVHVGWDAWRRYVPEADIVTKLTESVSV